MDYRGAMLLKSDTDIRKVHILASVIFKREVATL